MGAGRFAGMPITVHVAPESDRAIEDAVREAGGEIGPLEEADALVWVGSNPDEFPDELPDRRALGAAAVGRGRARGWTGSTASGSGRRPPAPSAGRSPSTR